MYSKDFYINASDVDEYKCLKPSGIFKLFQDTTVQGVEETPFNTTWLTNNHLMWVITRVNVEIVKLPKYLENVNLSTYPCETMKVIYPRHFFIKDDKGNILVKMSTTWALLDDRTRTFSSIGPDVLQLGFEKHDYQLPLPKRLKPSLGELVDTRVIRYSDCDLNRHLNNTRYIDYIFDLFDGDFFKGHKISNIRIDYLSEILEKEELSLYKYVINEEENIYQVIGKVHDKTCFVSELTFKNNLTK